MTSGLLDANGTHVYYARGTWPGIGHVLLYRELGCSCVRRVRPEVKV
jgi:hypothetical protein